jgi:lipid A 4'-phosphatase
LTAYVERLGDVRPMGLLRRDWLPEAAVFIALAVAVTLVFAVTPLDIAVARIFYRPDVLDHWPLGKRWPWSLLYQCAPFITVSLLMLGLIGVLVGHLRSRETWRINGAFLILSVVIGPGLIINAVFKDHWDRPRPRDVVQFSGTLQYTPAPLRGEGGGSFPCGHCSVGFLYASGWWLWRRRRPAWARASLTLGLALGIALGLGRMAAGGHFLSDVLWSALLALGLAHALYYYILRIPRQQAAYRGVSGVRLVRRPGYLMLTAVSLLGAALVLIALFVTPHGNHFSTHVDLSTLSPAPRVLEVSARTANIDIVISDSTKQEMLMDGELHGFGLPASRLDATTQFRAEPVPTLIYRIEQRGWMTDLDASATIRVPPGELQLVVVRLQRGNIRVADTTRDCVVNSGTIRLDLHTAAGHVQPPDR